MNGRLCTLLTSLALAMILGASATGCFVTAPTSSGRTVTSAAATEDPQARAALESLLQLMQQRLLLMHDVARWKWNARQPIADPARERAFLAEIVAQARKQGLDAEETRRFFEAQIDAARQVQQHDFQRWQLEQPETFADVPDLATAIRPRIDDLSRALLTALMDARPYLRTAAARQRVADLAEIILTGDGITDGIRRAAIAPLLQE